jgi:hypothetical protein
VTVLYAKPLLLEENAKGYFKSPKREMQVLVMDSRLRGNP